MASEIIKAIQALCDEKGLSYENVLETIESALGAAYRKDFGNRQQNIKVVFDPETADIKAWDIKTVVEDISEEALEDAREELSSLREKAMEEGRELTEEEVESIPRFNPKTDLMMTEAKEVDKKAKVGDVLEIVLEVPGEFGRMAAQTAKQVVIQKVREAERNIVFEDFKDQVGQIVMGSIQRVEGRKVLVDIGKVTGILRGEDQVQRDTYRPGSRMKFFVVSVEMGNRGPEIILSRSHVGMVEETFAENVPEIEDQTIAIKKIARDAGFRSKVSVYTEDEAIDPIGSCIGQRGSRINTIIDELGGEKIDIIEYSENPEEYIANALSPAKILKVDLNEEEKVAEVLVVTDQFSLAIGRGGQNVRLASELTGWKIDVKEDSESKEKEDEKEEESEEKEDGEEDVEKKEKEEKTEDKKKKTKTKKKSKKEEKEEESESEEDPKEKKEKKTKTKKKEKKEESLEEEK